MDLGAGELRAFVTVAEELHFGRAALRLNISQPQVSRRVRALEETLGVELFVRTARRTTLTDAGRRSGSCGAP
jgi:DNA-binding transcriptional LysR family regulator